MKAALPALCLVVMSAACEPHASLSVHPTTAAPATATASESVAQGSQVAPSARRAPFDPSAITMVMDDPRLAEAKTQALAGKPMEAARAIERAIDQGVDGPTIARWQYQAALQRSRAGDPKGAALAFERSAAAGGPLEPFALLAAGERWLGLSENQPAATDLSKIDAGRVPEERLGPLLARALVRVGRADEGFARYRSVLARHPKTWPTIALDFARALLSHPGGTHADEAARLALDVELDGPASRESEAKKVRDEAEGALSSEGRKFFDAPPPAERAARAKRLVASGRGKKALVLTNALMKEKDASCAALEAHAAALADVGRRSEASSAYDKALAACAGDATADLGKILFDAGKAAQRGGDLKSAIARYERLEASFPEHALADDARVAGAKAALDDGDEPAFVSALSTIADTYPRGDATSDGVFTLAFELVKRAEWSKAIAPLSTGVGRPKERSYARAGRFSYFLARALQETGKPDEAKAELARTIVDYPLSYYAALAHARLEEMSFGSGAAAFDAMMAREPPAPPEAPSDDVVASDAFRAALELASEDDTAGVLAALDVLGVGDRSAAPEITLAGAEMLTRTSEPSLAHSLLRSANEYEPRVGRKELYAYRDVPPIGAWRTVWEAAYPRAFAPDVERASKESGVPAPLLFAIAREESAFLPQAISRAGAIGLTQVMPDTAKRAAKRLGLPSDEAAIRDPGENLRLGAHFLKQMRDGFPDDVLLAIPAYNAGPKAPEGWAADRPGWSFDLFVEDIPFTETRGYTKRVIGTLATYDVLYGSRASSEALHAPKLARAAP